MESTQNARLLLNCLCEHMLVVQLVCSSVVVLVC